VGAPRNAPSLIWPTLKSKGQAEIVFVMVNTIEIRRNKKSEENVGHNAFIFHQIRYGT
jgi:hypothetical protein